MSAPLPPTILDLKLEFLRSQIQALSQPLSIPSSYQPTSEENALRQKSIDTALLKLNETIKKHSKRVYPSQAQRHVAEQIDKLYWQAGAQDVGAVDGLERGTDFSLQSNIEKLPDSWDDEGDEDKRARYYELAESLKDMDERRKQLREKVAGFTMLKKLLEPFENPTETVQGNLVARDGELEKELEKMRMLIARVRGRVEALPENTNPDRDMEVDFPDEIKRVEALF